MYALVIIARRPFLPGEEASWIEARRARLRSLLVRGLHILSHITATNGEHTLAVQYATEIIELEPFQETGYRHLMRMHSQTGNRGEAVRVFGKCRELFREEEAMVIRREQPADISAIRRVNREAFETPTEADLVDALRELAQPIVSLVAEDVDTIVGHILFSPAVLLAHPEIRIMGLAPMAVIPARQRHGIGSTLVREGLDRCRQLDVAVVIVVGHAHCYPRFGFARAPDCGVTCEYEVPDESFMLVELEEGVLKGKSGTVRYHEAFNTV